MLDELFLSSIEMIFANNFARNYEKKIILGTSDAWSMRQLSQQPSILATQCTYCIEDCRIFGATWGHLVLFHELSFFFHCNPILVQMCILLLVKELAGLIIQ